MRLLLLLILAVFQVTMTDYLVHNPDFYQLDSDTWESDDFRAMKLGEYVAGLENLRLEELTAWMIEEEYDLTDFTEQTPITGLAERRRPVEFRKLKHAYEVVLGDLKFFPIPSSSREDFVDVVYEEGWLEPRTYGGKRRHEGCDIMGTQRPRGYYPVVSMSDGIIEKTGWLEQGGFRVGVRAPGGLYLYYAHLYGYSREWKEGDTVKAGELLGFMGDTGYSAIEGTTGNFDVHLHVGLYLRTDHYEELSINPYWILRWLEKKRLCYHY